jgi:hypothetical protein
MFLHRFLPVLASFPDLTLRIFVVSRSQIDSQSRLSDPERPFIRARSGLHSALLNFGLRSDGQLRCADGRPLADPTDRRC